MINTIIMPKKNLPQKRRQCNTDDIIIVGDYVWAPSESHPNTGLWRFEKADLSNSVKFDVLKNNPSASIWGIEFDGLDIWYAGYDKVLGKFNPQTLESFNYESPFTYNVNEIVSDGQTMFVTGLNDYPVNGEAFIGKTTKPNLVINNPSSSKMLILAWNGSTT